MADSNTLSAQRAKGYLRELGWTNNQAAGLVGNFQQESGINLNPSAVSPDGTSYGIAQWTAPRQNVFQQTYGKSIVGSSLKEQLDFVNYELNTTEKAAGDALRATKTPAEAALVVSNQYERPAASAANNAQRVAYANSAAQTPTAVADNNTLSASEQDKLNNQAPSEPGDAIRQAVQKEADAELGVGKVEVGQPIIIVENTETPNAPNATVSTTTINVKPLPNRLHAYPSYIYGLSLHILSAEQYNNVVVNQTYTPANVLVASAGRYSSSFPRNEFFSEDFYFEDCDITTVIGPNDVSRNTNAVELKFTLIEPYGFTLVERLLRVSDALKSKNYLDMPYLLQIDFFAMDDSGNIVGSINDLRKRIPIKIIKMDIRVTGKGAEYKISAVPFNHSAYEATSVTTPANFEITASTVAEFFQSAADAEQFSQLLAVQNSAAQRETATQNTPAPTPTIGQTVANAARVAVGKQPVQPTARNATKQPPPTKKTYTTVKSYGSAINDWYRALKESRKTSSNDIYRFEFLPDPETGEDVIGTAQFIQKNINTPKDSPMKSNQNVNDQITMARSDLGDTKTGIHDITKAIFQVQYGTTIEKLLEYVIRNSDYIQRQLIVPEDPDYDRQKEAFKNKPFYWFRIVPIVRLLEFDNRRRIWTREITYTVQPYKEYNVRLDVGPQGVQMYPVKSYNYIYTGTNDDVLDFDINFNALYYNQVTAYRDSMGELNPSASSYTTDYQYQNSPNYGGGEPPKSIDYNAVMPMVVKPIVQNSKAQATGGAYTAKEVASVDLADSLMTNSRADMLLINLKIIGDPDYIKQDDIFYRPRLIGEEKNLASQPSGDPRLLPNNGSLVMDRGGIYTQLLFRTPIDIDDATGLMKFDPNYKHSVFSGLYRVMKIVSHFNNGQFLQDVEMIRLPRQVAFDYVSNNQNNKSSNRDESSQQLQPGLSPPNPNPTPSTEVSGGGSPTSPADAADTGIDNTPGGDQPVAQIENADAPVESQSQADLRAVNETAPTETINLNNQPQTNTPTPVGGTRLADGSVLYNGPATNQNSVIGVSVDGQQLPVGVSQNLASGVYQYKGVNLPPGADDPATMNKFVSAINSGSTTVYSYVDPVSGKTITRTFNGASGTSGN